MLRNLIQTRKETLDSEEGFLVTQHDRTLQIFMELEKPSLRGIASTNPIFKLIAGILSPGIRVAYSSNEDFLETECSEGAAQAVLGTSAYLAISGLISTV